MCVSYPGRPGGRAELIGLWRRRRMSPVGRFRDPAIRTGAYKECANFNSTYREAAIFLDVKHGPFRAAHCPWISPGRPGRCRSSAWTRWRPPASARCGSAPTTCSIRPMRTSRRGPGAHRRAERRLRPRGALGEVRAGRRVPGRPAPGGADRLSPDRLAVGPELHSCATGTASSGTPATGSGTSPTRCGRPKPDGSTCADPSVRCSRWRRSTRTSVGCREHVGNPIRVLLRP